MDNDPLNLTKLSTDQEFDFLNIYHSCNHDNIIDQADDSLYSNINLSCKFIDENDYISDNKNIKDFSFFSFNIQSLQAKFVEFENTILNLKDNNCEPDVILLQEIWNNNDPTLLSINGYHPLLYKTRSNCRGGGVGLYIKKNYRFNILDLSVFYDRILESLFVELWITNNNKKFNWLIVQTSN